MARLRTHTNPFNYYQKMDVLCLSESLSNPFLPVDLEIGFGRGRFLSHWARKYPNRNIIGVEVRKNITELLQKRLIQAELIDNTHIIHGSGERVLEDSLSDLSLDTIFVFHPDPWFKKRHHKRRFIRPEIVGLMAQKLKPGGRLHLSTDVSVLWETMAETLAESDQFQMIKNHPFWNDDYTSHWHEFSERDERTLYCASFERKRS
jgi:tRNA (guanine-N7-)-methyltransferase